MKYKVLAAAIATASLNAHALDGKVVNNQGRPIAGAIIEVTGTPESITTNEQGQFKVENDVAEIHVTAPGYGHRTLHLHELNDKPLVITLAPTVIEQLDVIGLPIHASVTESAMPVAVLSGEALRDQQAATLGDTLEGQVGVHTSFHGNVASTPIIRGLSGPRVMITQNGLDVSDVSRVGPDHSVASEVSTAQQVEILRGPATLFYGSGAIGGVVNVVDQRVPTDKETRGEWLLSHDTVNSQELASFNLNTGTGNLAFHADGFWRDSENYEVPVAPEQDEHEEDHGGDFTVANSAEESSGYTLGTSYLLDNGYVGLSVGRLDRKYGIPGHSHGHAPEGEEVNVHADLKQDRYQLLSELDVDLPLLRAIHTRAAYTEYSHAEIEDGTVGTVFSNETSELRVDLLHQEIAHWRGGVNLHYKNSKIAAEGEEAFTPPSESETLAVAIMEEKHIGDVLVQFGARIERVTIDADNVLLPDLAVHGHDEAETGEHEHDAGTAGTRTFAVEQEFTPVSVSLGAVWDFRPGYNVGVSLSRSQRAPSASELLSFGPHVGTRSYEVGALFELHEEDHEAHFEVGDAELDLEAANNIDLTFRKHEGELGIILNAFYNKVDNYYYQAATGLFAESGHDHDHAEGAEEEEAHEGELPVYLFTSADAILHGFEAQGIWQVTPSLKTTVFSDYVRAELDDGAYLPRTPPLRYGARLDYDWQKLSASLAWTHYGEQDQVAELETPTDGYDWVDATVTYYLPVASSEIALFLKAENLTDTEARVHTSFLKDITPRPGRNFSVGLRGTF